MADGPQDYRDPKVTTTSTTAGSGSRNWLWYIIGAVLLLLLLGWLLGLFSANDEAAVIDEPAATEGTASTTTVEPATEGATTTTVEPAVEGTATEPAAEDEAATE
jgi:hypothetical protein